IKRAEVAGDVVARLGLSAEGDESELEELVKARTVRAMVDWLTSRLDDAPVAPPAPRSIPAQSRTEAPAGGDVARPGVAPTRLLPTLVPVAHEPVRPATALAGATLVVTGRGPAADSVAELLRRHGATVRAGTLAEPGPLDGADGLILLEALAGSPEGSAPLLPGAFGLIKQVLAGRPRYVLAAADANAGACTDGLRGLMRTVAREYPSTAARLAIVDGTEPADRLAQQIVDELLAGGDAAVVNRSGRARQTYEMVPASLGPLAAGGAGPAGDGVAEARAVGLDRDSVVVLVGGARGITSWFARALAGAAGCRIELIGRTPRPQRPEDPALAAATDEVSLRAALARQGGAAPAEIARKAQAILAGREVDATVRELGELGAQVRYHALDVRDVEATDRLVAAIHREHGRIDGLVYAAGVIEDKLIADKDPQSFARVFDTKVAGAQAVLDALDRLACAPKFVVFFGSVAATYGNRGQADYAAANDALEAIGARWSTRSGNRCLTVHWGPWAPAEGHSGMVSVELSREYARRGVTLIDPQEGALSLLGELAWGDPALTAVVYTTSAR
ncbi:SDR family NAD(P)-dependent oxidoreductase, partial [Dactylosporangium darangshiense]